MDTSISYYRYGGYFHFNTMDDVPIIVGWLKERFIEVVASLEHMDHENKTDRHIQWAGKTITEWTRSDTSLFDKKGRYGKNLVAEKKPNAGSKHSKRHSKLDYVVEGYDWQSCLLYVGKEQKDTQTIWWYKEGVEQPCDDIIGKFKYPSQERKENGSKEKAVTFFEYCCRCYEKSGKPGTRKEVVMMLAEHYCFGKWQNMEMNKLCAMADTLLMKYHGNEHINDIETQYEVFISKRGY